MIKKILSVDDDDITQFINANTITDLWSDAEVVLAGDGKDAIEVIDNMISSDIPPDLILLDLNMPVMDGWEFLEEYHKKFYQKYRSTIYLAVLSSTIDKKEIDRAEQHQCVNRFIQKPITKESLTKILEDIQR